MAKRYDAPIDLVLTDLVMPELDGRACVEQLRAQRADLKALFMSGYPPQEIARQGLDHRHVPFLPKPFSPHALARSVREVIDGAACN